MSVHQYQFRFDLKEVFGGRAARQMADYEVVGRVNTSADISLCIYIIPVSYPLILKIYCRTAS